MSLRFSDKYDGFAYRCTDRCRKIISIRNYLTIHWPKSITLKAYVATLFLLFPKGITNEDLSSEIESEYEPSTLSKKHAKLFLQ